MELFRNSGQEVSEAVALYVVTMVVAHQVRKWFRPTMRHPFGHPGYFFFLVSLEVANVVVVITKPFSFNGPSQYSIASG